VIRCQITNGPDTPLRHDVDLIQVRERNLPARQLAEFVRRAMTAGPRILVNDRLDVALACSAAGVHLRSRSVSPKVVRRIVPPAFLITVACHDEREVLEAEGADFVLLAPVFRPISKVDSRPPLGIERLRIIIRQSPVPVIALGGITRENAPACIDAGAVGIAGISLFTQDPASAVTTQPFPC